VPHNHPQFAHLEQNVTPFQRIQESLVMQRLQLEFCSLCTFLIGRCHRRVHLAVRFRCSPRRRSQISFIQRVPGASSVPRPLVKRSNRFF
jgi:hypothetical protein